ncbi:substrate-binding protein [Promicromonospora soli]
MNTASARTTAAATALGAVMVLTGCSDSGDSASNDTVRVGLLVDLSGATSLYGEPTQNVAELAVQQINEDGGVDGRTVELVVADEAGAANTGASAAQRLIDEDGVAALFGMHSSASREAVAPITETADIPYFYTPLFEGGTCQANMITNGEVPAQQLATTIPWVQEQTGNNEWFLIGADYIWGQQVVERAAEYVEESGGEVVGTDFVPLGTTDFQGLVSKIKASGATALMPALNGGDAIAFEKQAYDAGIGNSVIPRLALMYENATRDALGPEVAAGMYNALGYDDSIDSEANAAFLDSYHAEFGDDAAPVTALSEQTWVALKGWAEAANAADSIAASELLPEVAGLSIDGPAGTVTFDENHYVTQPIYVTQTNADGSASAVESFPAVASGETCDLPLGD